LAEPGVEDVENRLAGGLEDAFFKAFHEAFLEALLEALLEACVFRRKPDTNPI
jgi:hypothetical protein